MRIEELLATYIFGFVFGSLVTIVLLTSREFRARPPSDLDLPPAPPRKE